MICLRPFALLGLLAVVPFALDGCSSKAGTSGGVTVTPAKPRVEERIAAAPVQEIPPPPEPVPVPLRSVGAFGLSGIRTSSEKHPSAA